MTKITLKFLKNMEIQSIIVPKGIKYLSDWEEYSLRNFPFPHILDKVLTGCGFTEYCIRNDQNIILCSPRKLLLQNKADQHPGELYYFRNDLEIGVEYDRSFSKNLAAEKAHTEAFLAKQQQQKDSESNDDEVKEKILFYKQQVKDYYMSCPFKANGKACKIIVTYDSFRHVKEALIELLGEERFKDEFQVVIDEWQSIFVDAKFKPDTELELLGHLRGLTKICFASATPMMDQYLDKLDDFKDLPYFRLDWETADSARIIKPIINVKSVGSITTELNQVIQNYLNGKFEVHVFEGEEGMLHKIVSNEAVLYVNSVKHICQAIKVNKLLPEQCNVLCAKTKENEDKVRKAFNESIKTHNEHRTVKEVRKLLIPRKKSCIGTIPKLGEHHKMFTFCTRTVYLGADFYSTCARSFIFSDSNIDCLTIDIALDLPQIMGRQRWIHNPWKNKASIFVLKTRQKLSSEEFDKMADGKKRDTNNLLKLWEKTRNSEDLDTCRAFIGKIRACLFSLHYADDYIALNLHSGKFPEPEYNHLVEVAEKRAFDVQQTDYKDRFAIYNSISTSGGCDVISVDAELMTFNSLHTFEEKLKYACELKSQLNEEFYLLFINSIPKDYGNYILNLGPSRCANFSYHNYLLREELDKIINNQDKVDDVKDVILSHFEVGKRYSKSSIKRILGEIYDKLGYQKTPKASDLSEWFEIKSCLVTDPVTKNRDHGFLILNIKER